MSSDKHCCVPGCTSNGGNNNVLHGFPNPDKDKERFNTWLNAIGGTILNLEKYFIYKYRRVCHSHFEQKYLCRCDRISNIAVPTLNMSGFKNEKDKDAPPSKRVKPNKQPSEQQTKAVEQNVTEEQSGKAEENETDAGLRSPSPSHSDIHDAQPEPGPFSWQKSLPICIEKDDILSDISQPASEVPVVVLDEEHKSNKLNEVTDAPSKHDEDEEQKYTSEKHAEFSCDHCLGEIIGYTCVQCENFDLCRACEGQLVHPHHYMLRVPKPRPFNEIRSVVAAIRVKLKLLEEAFKQNSGDWADVVIKKEEDPLDLEETSAPPGPSAGPSLGESVVPIFDIDDSQEARDQDSMSALKDVQDKPFHCSPSTSVAESSIQKSTAVSKKRVVLRCSGISGKDVIFAQKDVVFRANLISAQRNHDISNKNLKFVKHYTANSNKLRLHKESKDVSHKNVILARQNPKTHLTFVQQIRNINIPKADVVKDLQKTSSNIKRTSIQDAATKNDANLPQAVSNANVLKANAGTDANEMFEEYLEEMWLDESILAEDNNEKDRVTETKEKEETSPKEKSLETIENINKHTRARTKESKILNYKIKEATTSKEDVIQPSNTNMLPVGETDDVTVVRTNVNQSNVEKPYNYYYYNLLPKRDRQK